MSEPRTNMYDCVPCPKCGSKFCAPYKRTDGHYVECDDCGHKYPAKFSERVKAWLPVGEGRG